MKEGAAIDRRQVFFQLRREPYIARNVAKVLKRKPGHARSQHLSRYKKLTVRPLLNRRIRGYGKPALIEHIQSAGRIKRHAEQGAPDLVRRIYIALIGRPMPLVEH